MARLVMVALPPRFGVAGPRFRSGVGRRDNGSRIASRRGMGLLKDQAGGRGRTGARGHGRAVLGVDFDGSRPRRNRAWGWVIPSGDPCNLGVLLGQ